MSIDGAKYILEGVASALSELYPQHAEAVFANMQAGEERLDALQAQMHASRRRCAGGRVIMMNEALVYTAEELGLEIAGHTRAKAASRSTKATWKTASNSSRRWTRAWRWWKSRPRPR